MVNDFIFDVTNCILIMGSYCMDLHLDAHLSFHRVIFAFDSVFMIIHVQVYHVENKFGPMMLLSAINAFRTDRSESVCASSAKKIEVGSFAGFLSEVSEELSSQLHGGIVKAGRRVLLDEIIGNIITEFVATKKAHRHLKLESVNQIAKSRSSDTRMVM